MADGMSPRSYGPCYAKDDRMRPRHGICLYVVFDIIVKQLDVNEPHGRTPTHAQRAACGA